MCFIRGNFGISIILEIFQNYFEISEHIPESYIVKCEHVVYTPPHANFVRLLISLEC